MKKKIILSTAGVLVLVAAGYYVLTGSTSSDDKALARIKVTKGNIVDKALAVIEYARNVLNIKEADHAESNPDASVKIVAPLSCSLVGVKGNIVFKAGSKIQMMYNAGSSIEGYHCSYGLNPKFRSTFEDGKLATTAFDEQGEVRAIELAGHPFFVATLFQPELSALEGKLHPLIQAFVAKTW